MNRTHHQPLSPCCLFSFNFVSKQICNTAYYLDICVQDGPASSRIKSSNIVFIDTNCHFHAMYVTLLNINVHFKPFFFSLKFPFKTHSSNINRPWLLCCKIIQEPMYTVQTAKTGVYDSNENISPMSELALFETSWRQPCLE